MNLKDILDQSIDVNKQKHPTGTLDTTFLKPVGEENPYVQLGSILQTIFLSHPTAKSRSMNTNLFSENK